MADIRLEELVEERWFAGDLQAQAEVFFRLANTLLAHPPAERVWNKRHYFQLINEADSLESFLDDFGARYNQTYSGFTSLVASLRWFAYSGFTISHLLSRFQSYGDSMWADEQARSSARREIEEGLLFLQTSASSLLGALLEEAAALGMELPEKSFSEKSFLPLAAQKKLPRNVGQDALLLEEQITAEVATKFLEAAQMLRDADCRFLADDAERHSFVKLKCTEAFARVYQATVHNLQSTYDTHLQNTVLEHQDVRLPQLRGHASVALHLLQAVTYLSHFIERHENDAHFASSKTRIIELINCSEVEHVTVNIFLLWAHRLLQNGVPLAEDLLPAYSNQQDLIVKLDPGVKLHARPAALIVGIVNKWGTPVGMELGGQRCNAGSILEMLVLVGSNDDPRKFVFQGDERPLKDIELLFTHGLGEQGLSSLPRELDYLQDAN